MDAQSRSRFALKKGVKFVVWQPSCQNFSRLVDGNTYCTKKMSLRSQVNEYRSSTLTIFVCLFKSSFKQKYLFLCIGIWIVLDQSLTILNSMSKPFLIWSYYQKTTSFLLRLYFTALLSDLSHLLTCSLVSFCRSFGFFAFQSQSYKICRTRVSE